MEHGHSEAEIAARLKTSGKGQHLKDMIFGGFDGTVTTFAIVAGVAGAGLSSQVIVALGLANILADGFSMAAGNYSGTKAVLDDRKRLIAVEQGHIQMIPEGERSELRQILRNRGLSGDVLEDATEHIALNEDKWIEIMLTDEYNLPRTHHDPLPAALATFTAFLSAGFVPLLPFLLGLEDAFAISVAMTCVTFFVIGATKSRWSLAPWWRSGAETLAIGAVAAALAYGVGSFFHP